MSNILFELEVKLLEGNGPNSTIKIEKFTADDFDWTTDMYLPSFDISDKMSLLGNYYTNNSTKKR